MEKFVYVCDKNVGWIDVLETQNNYLVNENETTSEQEALKFAKTYNKLFEGYSDTEKEKARILTEQVKAL